MKESPKGWALASLGCLADYINGVAFKPTDWGSDGVPIIRIQNLTDRSKPFNRTTRCVADRYRVKKGDILVSWSATLDAFLWEGDDSWLNQHIFRVEPHTDIISKECLFYLLKKEIRSLIETEHLHGTTMRHINRGPFLAHSVLLPPRREQDRIVEKLDRVMERSAKAREELRRVEVLAERYKRAVLSAAFSGELTAEWRLKHPNISSAALVEEIAARPRKKCEEADWYPDISLPESWAWVSVDQLAVMVQYGSSVKTGDDPSGIPVLRMGNIVDGQLDFASLKYLPADHFEFPDLLLEPGDILFNRTNSAELVGKTAVYDGTPAKASFASYLVRVRVEGMKPELLSAYINSEYGREWVASVASQQAGQANVNSTKLRRMAVPLMPAPEQEVLWRTMEASFRAIDGSVEQARRALALIDRLEQQTLAKAFRGELVSQDSNDKPAAQLLESIKSARDQEAPRRGRANRRAD